MPGIDTVTSPTTAVYTTAAKVAAFLQVDAFTTTSIPTQAQVEDMIFRAQDEIDRRAGHAWREHKVTNEYRTMFPTEFRIGFWAQPRIQLDRYNVKTFSSVSGDKLEVFTASGASGYDDWIVTKTENRATGDFWVDYEDGEVHFRRSYPLFKYQRGIRVTYRYGDTVVPKWIEDIATKMTAMEIMANFKQYAFSTPEVTKSNIDSTLRMWKEEMERQLEEQRWITRRRRVRLI